MSSLEELSKKIEEFNKRDKKKLVKKTSNGSLISIEIFSGVVVGAIFGYIIDFYMNTKPIFIIICLIFGIIGAFLNIYKIMVKKRK